MKFGVSMFVTDHSARPADIARAAEERGFESFWVSEHSHMPVDTEFPLAETIPREYLSMLDPFVALTDAAAATNRIRLGTAITLIVQRDPINCAKSVASLDFLSGGRVTLGVGAGWNEGEMQNHGTDPSTRFRLMRERVEAMRVLWSDETPEYHNRHVDFDPVWQWPKPVQDPLPVLIAGGGDHVLDRILGYGNGWLPAVSAVDVPEALRGRVIPEADFLDLARTLLSRARDSGVPTPDISTTGVDAPPERVSAYRDAGINRMILRLPSAPLPEALEALDAHAAMLRDGGNL